MIAFSIIAAIMIIIAFIFILPPLFKKEFSVEEQAINTDTNLAIARERLHELNTDLASGKISQEDFEQVKSEVELSLAETLSKESDLLTAKHNQRFILPLMVLIPVLAIAIYQFTGTPIALEPEKLQAQLETEQQAPDAEAMIAALAKRLEERPQDGEGWSMLARSYVAMGRFSEAVPAFEKAHTILGDSPTLLADHADAIGRANNSDLTGAAKPLLLKALDIDPNHPKSRWLAGMLAFQEQDYAKVSEYLEPLLSQTEPGTELHEGLKGMINEAGNQSGQAELVTQQTVKPVALTVDVVLSSELVGESSLEDSVFVFAKATQGPPIPLAVVKLQVKDLPAQVILDDSRAMRPDLKISQYGKVSVSARVSKSGNAVAASGDFQSQTVEVDTQVSQPITLSIENKLP